MDSINSLADKLPDIYFDWYARLLPGGAAVLIVLFESDSAQLDFALKHPAFMIVISYVLGHFIQPGAAFVVKLFECEKTKEEVYAFHKRHEPKPKSLLKKVSKAHAEAVSMMSSALLVTGIFFLYAFLECSWRYHLLFLAILLVLFCYERVGARYRKISDLGPDPNQSSTAQCP